MDENQRKICHDLRSKSSKDAASWILENYPISGNDWGEALILIPHRSWEKADQVRLANYYLSKIPYANDRGYQAFSSIMKVSLFIDILMKQIPSRNDDRRLLSYYLLPVLDNACKTEKERKLFSELVKSLQ